MPDFKEFQGEKSKIAQIQKQKMAPNRVEGSGGHHSGGDGEEPGSDGRHCVQKAVQWHTATGEVLQRLHICPLLLVAVRMQVQL